LTHSHKALYINTAGLGAGGWYQYELVKGLSAFLFKTSNSKNKEPLIGRICAFDAKILGFSGVRFLLSH
jgi:hypothetical protein